eukprot:scaffold8972_cov118-Isochrysis_galbana.AAC.18
MTAREIHAVATTKRCSVTWWQQQNCRRYTGGQPTAAAGTGQRLPPDNAPHPSCIRRHSCRDSGTRALGLPNGSPRRQHSPLATAQQVRSSCCWRCAVQHGSSCAQPEPHANHAKRWRFPPVPAAAVSPAAARSSSETFHLRRG